jgi:hypothetical protein
MPVIKVKGKTTRLKYPANWNEMTTDEKKKYTAKKRKASLKKKKYPVPQKFKAGGILTDAQKIADKKKEKALRAKKQTAAVDPRTLPVWRGGPVPPGGIGGTPKKPT